MFTRIITTVSLALCLGMGMSFSQQSTVLENQAGEISWKINRDNPVVEITGLQAEYPNLEKVEIMETKSGAIVYTYVPGEKMVFTCSELFYHSYSVRIYLPEGKIAYKRLIILD